MGIKFKSEEFEQEWIDEGKVTTMEEIGSIMHIKQKNFAKKVIKKTKKAISWEDIVDAEINDEMNKIGLGIVRSKSTCTLI